MVTVTNDNINDNTDILINIASEINKSAITEEKRNNAAGVTGRTHLGCE